MKKTVFAILAVIAVSGCTQHKHVSSLLIGVEPGRYTTKTTKDELPRFADKTTLADCLAYAALNNAGLEAAFNRWEAALENVPQVSSLPDPQFSYSYEIETRVWPQRQKFDLSQMFPWFGKLQLRSDAAAAAAEAARCQYEQQKLELFFKVKQSYFEYCYLSRAIALTEENLLLLGSLEEVARSKYESGQSYQTAVLRFQIDIGKIEDRLVELRNLRGPVVAQLNAAMNRPVDAPLPWPEEMPQEEVNFSDEQLFIAFREGNQELAGLDRQIEKARHEIKLSWKNYYPDFSLGLMFDTGEAVMDVDGGGDDPLAMTASISLPLNRGKYRAGEREALAHHRAAVMQKKEVENNLSSDLQLALYGFRDSQRKIDLYQNALIPKAQQSLNVIQRAFTVGTAQFLDMIDAVRTLLEFELAYERARADRGQKLAKIEMLIGKSAAQ